MMRGVIVMSVEQETIVGLNEVIFAESIVDWCHRLMMMLMHQLSLSGSR